MESDDKTCPECGVTWSCKGARTQHFKSAHPEAYNEWLAEGARIGRDKRSRPPPPSGVTRQRWTSEEDEAMAKFELANPELKRTMNQAIHRQVHRESEAEVARHNILYIDWLTRVEARRPRNSSAIERHPRLESASQSTSYLVG